MREKKKKKRKGKHAIFFSRSRTQNIGKVKKEWEKEKPYKQKHIIYLGMMARIQISKKIINLPIIV